MARRFYSWQTHKSLPLEVPPLFPSGHEVRRGVTSSSLVIMRRMSGDDSPGKDRNYSTIESSLLPDREPTDFNDGVGIEMSNRNRSESAASNISDHGKMAVPKEEVPLTIGFNILLLLFLLGLTTGVVNGCAQWLNKMISVAQAQLIETTVVGPMFFMWTTAAFAAMSAFIVFKGNKAATIGSGMPEVKALLVSDFHHSDFPNIVSFRIGVVRLLSLVTAVGSGLSIGIAAPLVHVSICTAYTVMNVIPDFGEFLENHAIRKQIFAAAAAVGMSTVFNAPVGGLLLSLELTSTFYLVSNYWRSFMVATTGAVMYSVFSIARKEEGRIFQVPYVENPYEKWEFATYAALGFMCGILGLQYLKLHQSFFLLVKPYTIKYPVSSAAVAGTVTALLIFAAGAHSAKGVSESVIVHDVFQDCSISMMSSRHSVSPLGGLFASLIVRVFLTLIGTTLRISCGVFLPVVTIGSLLGRIFGQILAYACGNTANIYVAGYAMVGAVAFVSGTTHTISIAVIVMEQTGQFSMLLPCLVGAVIACGITKSRSLSLYDQGMVNKGLESFELLLKESKGFKYAADVLDEKVTSVSNVCTISDLFALMGNVKQSTFPVTSNSKSARLIGCIDRQDVFAFLKSVFEKENLYVYIRTTLPADAHYDDRRMERQKQIDTRRAWISNQAGILGGRSVQEYDDEGHPVSKFKGMFGMLNRGSQATMSLSDDEHSDAEKEEVVPDGDAVNPLHHSPGEGAQPAAGGAVPPETGASNNTPFKSPSPREMRRASSASTVSSLTNDDDNRSTSLGVIVERFAHRMQVLVQSPNETDQNSLALDAAGQARVEELLKQEVDMSLEPLLPINGFPFTAHRYTTMDQLYVLFEMVKVNVVFVVSNSKRLEGMISKNLLMQSLKKNAN